MAKPMNTWSDFRKTLTELKDPQVKEIFKTVVIDTADLAYGCCIKYVCDQNDVETIGEIPYGNGYNLAMAEFDECIRKILQMNYGLVIISHAQDKTFKDSEGNEFNQITPTLDKRGRLVCERTCDLIGYSRTVETDSGKKTRLFLRGTPRFVAGSRFKYTPDYIEFTYQNLAKAIAEAIDKESAENSGKFVTENKVNLHTETKAKSFQDLKTEFTELVQLFLKDESYHVTSAMIAEVVEKYLGKGKKVSECTTAQTQQLDMIVYDLNLMKKIN